MRHSSEERERRPVAKVLQRRLITAATLGAACIACGGEPTPTPPPPPPPALTCPSAGVLFCTDPIAAAAARDGTSDAATRSTPALENATARAALATNLGQLDGALNAGAGNITDARAALGRAREALAAAQGQLTSFPEDAPDLGAIELLLDYVAPLIGTS